MDIVEGILRRFKIDFVEARNEYKFCCPFHNDRSPSMYMNQDTGNFYCFGCKAKGSLKSFVKRLSGEEIKIEELVTPGDIIKLKLRKKYKSSAEEIRHYEDLAGFSLALKEEARNFIPAWTNIESFAYLSGPKRKFVERTMKKFKMLWANQGPYTGRIIMPLYRGAKCIGFNSRLLHTDKQHGKDNRYKFFVYNPMLEGYIYNLESVNTNYCILVEGIFDLMWMWQNGFENVVTTLSTTVSIAHVETLMKYKKIIFCFDQDANEAGQKATMKAASQILSIVPDKEVYTAILPLGKDANECSPEELQNALKNIKRIRLQIDEEPSQIIPTVGKLRKALSVIRDRATGQ